MSKDMKEVSNPALNEKDKVEVYGTEEGKLYIKPEELLALERVKDLIIKMSDKMSKLDILKDSSPAAQ